MTTDLAAPLRRVVDDVLHDVLQDTTQYANNQIECNHGRLEAGLRPLRGLRTDRTASTVIRGHAFVQNLRRGHYELGVEARHERRRVATAFDELAATISDSPHLIGRPRPSIDQRNSAPPRASARSSDRPIAR